MHEVKGEPLAGHPEYKLGQLSLKNCNKSDICYSIESPILLYVADRSQMPREEL